MSATRKLRFWNQVHPQLKIAAVGSILKGYKKVEFEFIQSDLATDLLAKKLFITTRQCKELIDTLAYKGQIVRKDDGLFRVV